MFKRPIAIGLSPNNQADDLKYVYKALFSPNCFKSGKFTGLLSSWFMDYLKSDNLFFFNSGRSALFCLLKSLSIGPGDEVIVQAFTCVAVPDPVIWVGARPVFTDIDASLNIKIESLEKAVNNKTKAIIVQHTFGIPANINKIKKIAQKYGIYVIEDCAHSLGAELDNRKIGALADAAFFSFGRDKVVSSVYGGAAVIYNNDKAKRILSRLHRSLPKPSLFWIFRQLLHPLAFSVILPFYNVHIGKVILFLLFKMKLLQKPVEKCELIAGKPDNFPAQMPDVLAGLLLSQLLKLTKFNKNRKKIAARYFARLKNSPDFGLPPEIKNAVYLRFNILTEDSADLLIYFKKRKILLGNWYKNIIDPKNVSFKTLGFNPDKFINARKFARLSLNLPTYPNMSVEDADLIVNLLNEYADKKHQR
ncbi:hypothetical protein A3E42_06300 [Candidatus Gottesmanbacteria bacterium RIFCSPHIGHO2_12_FULL_40_13]|nr:MAG: hypothetical protein A3E42_06300 [Candidatus Gottesmanbacteria bacterium RIFCSPHIGHO2_12_FULL_40_13]